MCKRFCNKQALEGRDAINRRLCCDGLLNKCDLLTRYKFCLYILTHTSDYDRVVLGHYCHNKVLPRHFWSIVVAVLVVMLIGVDWQSGSVNGVLTFCVAPLDF